MTAVHFFSNEVESAARGQTVRYLFVFTGESDSRNSWSLDSYNNVVKLAVCDLPDVPGIEQEMKKRLSDFGADSWVMSSQRRPEFNFNAQKMDISDISPIKYDAEMPQIANSCEGWYCDSYFWTFVHVNGELVSITIECTSWDYEDLCGGGGGVPDPFVQNGGEPGDGDSNYDPCDPIGPPMKIPPFECLDACNW